MPLNRLSVSFVGEAVDLRKSRRYRVPARASFMWERQDGLLQEGQGAIRDISDRGVFVTGDVAPPPGSHLEVDVYLPSLEVGAGAVQLHGEGTVIRVDRQAHGIQGFAAVVAFQTEAASGPTVVNPRNLQ
jgi:PilZ domain